VSAARPTVLEGVGVSGGVAIGKAVCISDAGDDVFRFQIEPENIEAEVARFDGACRTAFAEISKAREKMGRILGEELAGILEAQGMLLEDPSFGTRIVRRIREDGVNAEWAVARVCEELEKRFAEVESEYLRERSEDLRNVSRYLLRGLQGIAHHELSEIEGDVIIVARELTPADALRFAREHVVGFALEAGGKTSHSAIILRGLNLPAVVGLEGMLAAVTDHDPMIVDAEHDRVVLHPDLEDLDRGRRRAGLIEARDEAMAHTRLLAPTTIDGVEVKLLANLELLEEVDDALRFGSAGIGLYRSEFFFIEKSPEMPTEEEHYELFSRLLRRMAPRPVIVRTFDLGGRKLAQALLMDEDEENPVLGLRGIRLLQARPDILRPQLRALFRAASEGDLRVMIPLVTTLEEARGFRTLCREIVEELRAEGLQPRADVPLGAMIEVPAAAMLTDHLARELDFLSIGTNDLIQYSLAVDRNNEHVAPLYQPTHPAVLRLLSQIAVAAAGKCELSICGEMASDPVLTPFLLGIGLRRLSMNPRSIPVVKERLRSLRCDALDATVEACLSAATAEDAKQVLVDRHPSPALRLEA
jgi:phosphotransferase system enzyme I (PtsI)